MGEQSWGGLDGRSGGGGGGGGGDVGDGERDGDGVGRRGDSFWW